MSASSSHCSQLLGIQRENSYAAIHLLHSEIEHKLIFVNEKGSLREEIKKQIPAKKSPTVEQENTDYTDQLSGNPRYIDTVHAFFFPMKTCKQISLSCHVEPRRTALRRKKGESNETRSDCHFSE